jgi:hypothetical protein
MQSANAEEAAQEVWLRISRNKTYDPHKGRFWSFLCTIAHHAVTDHQPRPATDRLPPAASDPATRQHYAVAAVHAFRRLPGPPHQDRVCIHLLFWTGTPSVNMLVPLGRNMTEEIDLLDQWLYKQPFPQTHLPQDLADLLCDGLVNPMQATDLAAMLGQSSPWVTGKKNRFLALFQDELLNRGDMP